MIFEDGIKFVKMFSVMAISSISLAVINSIIWECTKGSQKKQGL